MYTSNWMQEFVDAVTEDPLRKVAIVDMLKRFCPFKADRAYLEVGTTSREVLQELLANENFRYNIVLTRDSCRYFINGTRDPFSRIDRNGTVELVFDDDGKLIRINGWNEVVPTMEHWWQRWRWIFRGK
jgi:hypothetical protein